MLGAEGHCDCLIPAKLAQQRNKRAVLTNKSSVSKSEWMDAAVPVFHIKHCWVFVLIVFLVQRSHFHPLGRGGDYVVLPGLLNPLARPETQRWERLDLYSTPWRGWSCSHSVGFRPPLTGTLQNQPPSLPAAFPRLRWCPCVEQFLVSCNPDQRQSFHCWQSRDARAPRAGTRTLQPPRAPAATLNNWDTGLISWGSHWFSEHVQMRKHRLSPAEPWECSRQD